MGKNCTQGIVSAKLTRHISRNFVDTGEVHHFWALVPTLSDHTIQ